MESYNPSVFLLPQDASTHGLESLVCTMQAVISWAYQSYVHEAVFIIKTQTARTFQLSPKYEMLKHSGEKKNIEPQGLTESPMTTKGKAVCVYNTLSDGNWKVTYQVTWQHYTNHNSTARNHWRIHCKMPLFLLPEWVYRVWQSFMWTGFCPCVYFKESESVG